MIMSLNGKKILYVLIEICNNKYTAMMCTYIFKIEYIIDSCLLKKHVMLSWCMELMSNLCNVCCKCHE